MNSLYKIPAGKQSKQKGAVMITVMVLLVVITLMGLSSMKQGLLNSQVGAAQTVSSMCFQAAESGLNGVYRTFQQQVKDGVLITDPRNIMNKATGENQEHCFSDVGLVETSTACINGLAENKAISVSTVTRKANSLNTGEVETRPIFENDIDKGGLLLIYTDSICQALGMNFAVTNTQSWQYRKNNSISSLSYTD